MIRRWLCLAFHLQFFLVTAAVIGGAVILSEVVADPIMDRFFDSVPGGVEWEEAGIGVLCALGMSGGLSFFLYLEGRRRLARLVQATEEMRRGNFAFKVPEPGSPDGYFNKLALGFNSMAETIENLMRNERRLLADISHELRSPLARISAGLELLRMRNSAVDADAGAVAHLGKIAGDIEHMRRLVSMLLEQGRIRLATLEARETVDLSAFARDAADGFQMKGATQRKTLLAAIEPGLRIEAHPLQVLLIFENILDNALFYTPPGSQIELRVRRSGGFARITVRDWGGGVPEEKLPSLFRAFFRVDPSRSRNSGGIGLGLTLVQEACQSLGGTITAGNASPGLEITVSLPLSENGSATPLSSLPLKEQC